MKTLGVLGGMGPAATLDFLAKLQAATPAKADEDHIRVIADINPQVPNRHGRPAEAAKVLGEMALGLKGAGADILAMPCNTAHAHAEVIRAASGLPFIDMIDAAVDEATREGACRIGILATPGGRAVYAERLAGRGLEAVVQAEGQEKTFMDLVYRVKAADTGPEVRAGMRALARRLAGQGAQVLIAGCTEVPLVLRADGLSIPLVDSSEVLARACVAACRG